MDEVYGTIERITFYNAENQFTVAKMAREKKKGLTCLVGTMPSVQPGETVRCRGKWHNHSQHGPQFLVEETIIEAPAGVHGIQKYLESGLIKGIGPVYAKRIIDAFGEKTLEIIDNHPERLREVPGLGAKRISKITACWDDQRVIRDVMIFLQSYGVSPAFAQRIFKFYRLDSINKLKSDPYCMARDVFGIGFKTADEIAQRMGVPHDSPERVTAGIEHVLSEATGDGHVCLNQDDLVERSILYLDVTEQLVTDCLDRLEEEGRIVRELPLVWRKRLYIAEKGIAHELRRITDSPCSLRRVDAKKAVNWVQEKLHIDLAANQAAAIVQSLSAKVQIITGGPGTGKSTITKAILAITGYLTHKIVLAAPTGRAAKRMSEITGKTAQTIHALLEFDFKAGGFRRGHEYPIGADLIIVDEASMIDTNLMNSLLKAVPSHARLIFVGDIDQLPSVGPGNVLRDMIDSGVVPVTQLTEIFRQARGSRIVTNAHRINQGEFPALKPKPNSDFFFIEAEAPEAVQAHIVDLVTRRLPAKYGFNPFTEIQVLAPMKKGVVGTLQLNTVLQGQLNPCDTPLFRPGAAFHPGDKVMQLRNNYDKKVYNGDVGRIAEINATDQRLGVDYDGRIVPYDFIDLDEITLAYAVSIHKYQGSECPCIVMPVHTTHFKLLHRNLLYTGITRGKKLVVLVGTKKAIAIAVQNNEALERCTGLRTRLTEALLPATIA